MSIYGPMKVSTWFTTEWEFRQVCGDAVSLAKGESAEEFAAKMMEKANTDGLEASLTQKQVKFLCDLADRPVPPRRFSP